MCAIATRGADAIALCYPHLATLRSLLGAITWGGVPIVFEGRTLGAIGFRCGELRPLSHAEESRLLAIAKQRGQALERARLHDVMEAARAEAEQASRAKDELLAMLGHELRNPLSPVLTAVQLMRVRGDHASAREQNIIERQVNHLIHLVDDLLDISRITRGTIELETQPLKLSTIVTRAIEIAGPVIEQHRHRVTVSLPAEEIWSRPTRHGCARS